MKKKYRFRNLPCTILPDDELWCVSGTYLEDGSAGILEWCYDKDDAKYHKSKMDQYGGFTGLTVHPFKK